MSAKITSGFFATVAGGLLVLAVVGTGRTQSGVGYAPMDPFPVDPMAGGFKVRVGSGASDEYGRRSFLADSGGNLEVAVQYQIKLPANYGPGGEICRVVVQSVQVPGCCGEEWKVDHVLPLDPFPVEVGQHVNDVVVVNVPPPFDSDRAAVRVVLESLEDGGEWKERSVKTVPIISL